MSRERAFTMVEIIMTLILLGVIGVVSTMFFGGYVKAFLADRQASEVAMKAQVALDRIALELAALDQVKTTTLTGTSIQFTNSTNVARTISYASGAISVNGNVLIDGLQSFSVSANSTGGGLSRSTYTVEFGIALEGVNIPYSVTIYPAN